MSGRQNYDKKKKKKTLLNQWSLFFSLCQNSATFSRHHSFWLLRRQWVGGSSEQYLVLAGKRQLCQPWALFEPLARWSVGRVRFFLFTVLFTTELFFNPAFINYVLNLYLESNCKHLGGFYEPTLHWLNESTPSGLKPWLRRQWNTQPGTKTSMKWY